MVTIELGVSSLFFFMLGFISCAAIIIAFAILWVVLPRITEAKRFFDFWLRIRDRKKDKK